MIGIEIDGNGAEIVDKCREEGVLVNCTAENVIRLTPPLVINKEQIDKVVEVLDKVLS